MGQYPKGDWRCHLCKFGTSCIENWENHLCTVNHVSALHKRMLKTGSVPVFKPRKSQVPSVPMPQASPAPDTTVAVAPELRNIKIIESAPTEKDSDRLGLTPSRPRNSLKSKEVTEIRCSTTEIQWSSSNTIHKMAARRKTRVRKNGFVKARRITRVRKKRDTVDLVTIFAESERIAPDLETDSERNTPDPDVVASDLKHLDTEWHAKDQERHEQQVRASLWSPSTSLDPE